MMKVDNGFWSKRYREEREIWLQKPSLTATFLAQLTPAPARIFEVGFGYGRDVTYLHSKGYEVHGMELSEEGFQMALKQTYADGINSANLLLGDFLQTSFSNQTFDAVYSHRVAHLFTEEWQINQYVKTSASMLKSGGYLLTSARDVRSKKPKRVGHRLELWDQDRFSKYFAGHFEIENFIEGEEIESANNPEPTFFTIMVARCKPV